MVTAKGSEYDKVLGLDIGADDYISKPFGMMELVSRIRAVLRLVEKTDDVEEYCYGAVKLNTRTHSVTVGGAVVDLTLKEFELLKIFLKNIGAVLTRDMLLEKILGYDFDGETRTVDVHVRTLRQNLATVVMLLKPYEGLAIESGDQNNEKRIFQSICLACFITLVLSTVCITGVIYNDLAKN